MSEINNPNFVSSSYSSFIFNDNINDDNDNNNDDNENVESVIKKCEKKTVNNKYSNNNHYFNLSLNILLAAGVYQLSTRRKFSLISRFLLSFYFWIVYIFVIILNSATKAIALNNHTKLDDLTDNISFLINHVMAVFKIALFIYKQKDLERLVEMIEGEKFLHPDCETFSANKLINKAIRMSQIVYWIYAVIVDIMIFNSCLNPILKRSEENFNFNIESESGEYLRVNRTLPFHSWYPFSTQISPNYELIFIYQIVALFYTAQLVLALDTFAVAFMIHIKVQLEILSHNLRYIIPHAKINGTDRLYECKNGFIKRVELLLEKNIEHHKAIIQLSKDFESVFRYQILLQFICSILAICMLLWQVSSISIMTVKFVMMFFYFGATGFQLLIYCWFGNEMMLKSLSVGEAAWNSKWYKLLSKRYSQGVSMIIHRSQRIIVITAGGFIDLNLDTFMKLLRAAYSCFAVLKKMEN